jgi:calcium release-activated calcium channel protein 1
VIELQGQIRKMGSSTMDAMQVLFTAFDTGVSSVWHEEDRSWRSEDRQWRAEDIDYRGEERIWREEERGMRSNELRWREEDMEQRHVENARYLWTRCVYLLFIFCHFLV